MRSLMTATCLGLLTAGCAGGGKAVKTVGTGIGAGVVGGLKAPLVDVNIMREKIPSVLVRAAGGAYRPPDEYKCAAIAAELKELNAALGPDVDAEPADEGDLVERGAMAISNAAADAMKDAATDFIPMRSWVRRLSGAAREDRKVKAAIRAGQIRRSYLKGFGSYMQCSPPASPSSQGQPVKGFPAYTTVAKVTKPADSVPLAATLAASAKPREVAAAAPAPVMVAVATPPVPAAAPVATPAVVVAAAAAKAPEPAPAAAKPAAASPAPATVLGAAPAATPASAPAAAPVLASGEAKAPPPPAPVLAAADKPAPRLPSAASAFSSPGSFGFKPK